MDSVILKLKQCQAPSYVLFPTLISSAENMPDGISFFSLPFFLSLLGMRERQPTLFAD